MSAARELRRRRAALPSLNLKVRQRVAEWMDEPTIPAELHRHALDGLRRLNRWSLAEYHLARVFERFGRAGSVSDRSDLRRTPVADAPGSPGLGTRVVRVIDLATGSGDLPLSLDRRMRKKGRPFAFSGCDFSSRAVAEAALRARNEASDVRFFTRDVLAEGVPPGYDVVTCSLFLHHLSDEQVVSLLASARESGALAIVVSDLDRSKLNYRAVKLACRLLTGSPVVKFDGPASVRSAYTPPEILALARAAGLDGVRVARAFPARWLLTWRRPS